MSTPGPSQLFKPNDGDRKKEETEGSGAAWRRVGKTRNKKSGEAVLGIGATAQFAATISCYRLLSLPCLCLFPNAASITRLETVLINPRANAAFRLFCSICILHPGAFGGCLL